MLRFWTFISLLGLIAPCSPVVQNALVQQPQSALAAREHRAWVGPRRHAKFSEVPHVSAHSRCEDSRPPQALATPDPLVAPSAFARDLTVSFIIGTDGRVHSPLILRSAGTLGDRNVLRTVRTWRYRPAMCNGVPTESEGQIEFSRR
jgi:TonB family protein